jgi:hypothetical protein
MASYIVGSWTDILNIPVLTGGDTVTMSTNFSTTDNSNKLSLNGASFNGASYTLTWGEGRTISPFTNLSGGVIENLTIDASNTDNYEAYLIYSGSNFGTIRNVNIVNGGKLTSNSGGIAGDFGSTEVRSFIEDCNVNISNSDGDGGGVCLTSRNMDISRCNVNLDNHTAGGGIVYEMYNDTTIDFCQVNVTPNTSNVYFNCGVARLLQGYSDGDSTCTIKNTYVNWIGVANGSSSSFVLHVFVENGNVTLNITNCHTNYTGDGGGFIGALYTYSPHTTNINITSCYMSEPSTSASIIDFWYPSNGLSYVNLDGVYTNGPTSFTPVPPSGGTLTTTGSFLSIDDIKDTLTVPPRWTANNSTFAMKNPGLPVISNVIVIPCFLPGTMIRTANGDIPIEKLSSNDLVTTTQGEKKVIEKIVIECNDSKIKDYEKPVCFTKGCLGNNLPSKDLWASRFHKILYNGEMLCANELFLRKDPVSDTIVDTFDNKVTGVIYHHLVLEGNYPYYANDVVAESAGDSDTYSLLENTSESI